MPATPPKSPRGTDSVTPASCRCPSGQSSARFPMSATGPSHRLQTSNWKSGQTRSVSPLLSTAAPVPALVLVVAAAVVVVLVPLLVLVLVVAGCTAAVAGHAAGVADAAEAGDEADEWQRRMLVVEGEVGAKSTSSGMTCPVAWK